MAKTKMENKKLWKKRFSAGSALILTVVLTTLLAIVGVVFVMMARVDKISTTAISENRELGFAVEAVIARISQELVSDVPRPKSCCPDQEYYDYPRHRVDPGFDAVLGTQDDIAINPGPDLIFGTIDDISFYGVKDDPWLANLEPGIVDYLETPADTNDDAIGFRHITDLYGRLAYLFHNGVGDLEGDRISFRNMRAKIITSALTIQNEGDKADADGDGVTDSRWIKLPNMTSSKGKTIYAAIRIVDNGAMLNVNTGFKFDHAAVPLDANLIDGSSQLQIDLMDLSWRPGPDGSPYNPSEETDLLNARANYGAGGVLDPCDLDEYERNVIWRYGWPNGPYTPFDIGDELELRNRFLLNHSRIDTRLESWGGEFRRRTELDTPVASGSIELDKWFYRSQHDVPMPGPNDIYSYRHLATTYNIDRIIDPNGRKMINVNEEIPVDILYNTLLRSNQPLIADANTRQQYAQLAANMVDFADDDTIVTVFEPNDPLNPKSIYYGFEAQPFITEIGMKSKPGSIYCAVELYNPFDRAINLRDFEIELTYDEPNSTGTVLTVAFGSGDRIERDGYFVIANVLREFDIYTRTRARQDPRLRFFGHWQPPGGRKPPVVPKPDRKPPTITTRPGGNGNLFLKRRVGTGEWIYVDQQVVDPNWVPIKDERYFGRDVRRWHVIYQTLEPAPSTLGISNNIVPSLFADRDHNFSFYLPNPIKPPYPTTEPQPQPYTKLLTVGDISRILTIGHGTTPDSTIGQQLWETDKNEEEKVRLNLQNPLYRNIFQYLTVFDPSTDGINNDGDPNTDENDRSEWKIPGRININTAPWYVIAQLPWMTEPIAQAIVAYRDKLRLPVDYRRNDNTIVPDPCSRQIATGIFGLREEPGFESIGELNFVIAGDYNYNIGRYFLDGNDLLGFPDLTTDGLRPGDGVVDDFEERDIIFSRISNLVTVRSDVFTAYILVRIGTDGPQKRVIAILDRSDVYPGKDKVRLVALHYVPDPR